MTYQTTNTTMPGAMRSSLKTRPRLDEGLRLVALVYKLLRSARACVVINKTRDTVLRNEVARPEAVEVTREWPVVDAALVADAVAAEPRGWVKDIRGVEGAGFAGFVPVSMCL